MSEKRNQSQANNEAWGVDEKEFATAGEFLDARPDQPTGSREENPSEWARYDAVMAETNEAEQSTAEVDTGAMYENLSLKELAELARDANAAQDASTSLEAQWVIEQRLNDAVESGSLTEDGAMNRLEQLTGIIGETSNPLDTTASAEVKTDTEVNNDTTDEAPAARTEDPVDVNKLKRHNGGVIPGQVDRPKDIERTFTALSPEDQAKRSERLAKEKAARPKDIEQTSTALTPEELAKMSERFAKEKAARAMAAKAMHEDVDDELKSREEDKAAAATEADANKNETSSKYDDAKNDIDELLANRKQKSGEAAPKTDEQLSSEQVVEAQRTAAEEASKAEHHLEEVLERGASSGIKAWLGKVKFNMGVRKAKRNLKKLRKIEAAGAKTKTAKSAFALGRKYNEKRLKYEVVPGGDDFNYIPDMINDEGFEGWDDDSVKTETKREEFAKGMEAARKEHLQQAQKEAEKLNKNYDK